MRRSRLEYAYAVGRVRALERHLIPRTVFLEAAEEKDCDGAMRLIYDSGRFLEEKLGFCDSLELDAVIRKENEDLERTTAEILLDPEIQGMLGLIHQPHKAVELAEDFGNQFVLDYFRHRVDLGNLKIFARIRYAELPQEAFESRRLRGGFLEDRFFAEAFDLSLVELGERLHASPYQEVWSAGVDVLQAEESFIRLERGIEDFLMSHLLGAKKIIFGPEPVFAYALGRRRELNLVRLVGIGTLNDIPAEMLKKRISKTYV